MTSDTTSDDLTLEQSRARHALQAVKAVHEQGASLAESYKREANGLAANIVNNGLGQTCATLLAKGDDGAKRLYEDMSTWLSTDEYTAPYRGAGDLVTAITQHGQRKYVHAQSEALAWLEWTKKFARAFLNDSGVHDG
ncbi:MAG: type III-B CRISPR module-associated protein Cmr5 [Persicimonas sp.]